MRCAARDLAGRAQFKPVEKGLGCVGFIGFRVQDFPVVQGFGLQIFSVKFSGRRGKTCTPLIDSNLDMQIYTEIQVCVTYHAADDIVHRSGKPI